MSHVAKILARGALVPPFDPLTLTELKAWYKTPIAGKTNGQTLTTWPDSSTHGNDITFADTSQQYATNVHAGNDGVLFSGGAGSTGSAIDLTSGGSFYYVTKASGTGFNHGYINELAAGHISFFYYDPSSAVIGADTGFIHAASNVATATNWNALSFSFDSSTFVVGVNGVDGGSVSGTGTTLYNEILTINQFSAQQDFCYTGEVLICAPRLSPTDDAKVKAYLINRWAL